MARTYQPCGLGAGSKKKATAVDSSSDDESEVGGGRKWQNHQRSTVEEVEDGDAPISGKSNLTDTICSIEDSQDISAPRSKRKPNRIDDTEDEGETGGGKKHQKKRPKGGKGGSTKAAPSHMYFIFPQDAMADLLPFKVHQIRARHPRT